MNLTRFLWMIPICLSLCAIALPSEAKMTTIDVTKFGAVPNDGKSDTLAVRAALEECKKHSPVTLKFPKGKYHFFLKDNDNKPWALFGLQEYSDITIDGGGSEFVMDGWVGVWSFVKCKGITIKNLSIDWTRPPFSLGRVLETKDKHFDVEVFKDYPVSGGEPVGAFMDYDPKTKLPARHGLDEYYTSERTEILRPQVLRVHLKHQARIKADSWVLLRHQVYGPGIITADSVTDITIKNVNVYTVPGMGFIGKKCHNITIDGFNVAPRPGSGRFMSATADAVHLSGNTGLISIKNCTFDGMGDDTANIKTGLYLIIKSRSIHRSTKPR